MLIMGPTDCYKWRVRRLRHHIFAFRRQDTYPYARAKTEVNQEKGQVIPCQC